jgi:nucleotide-binding universal stress UspA family protein
MVERIVVGIDGSGPSAAALHWALKRARATDARLTLEHVVDDEWGQIGPDYARALEITGEDLLARALEEAQAAGIDAHVALDYGSPATTLASAADPGELLVIGSHKTGYVRGRVLGTRSVVVASVARSTVVVVPEDNLAHRQGVVVGVTDSRESHVAIVAGASEAVRTGQELSLIHCGPDNPEAVEAGKRLLAASVELAATVAPGLVIRRRLSHRRSSDTLLDSSRTAALLVLGATRGATDKAGSIGSVTHEVLLNLTSPVMVAR